MVDYRNNFGVISSFLGLFRTKVKKKILKPKTPSELFFRRLSNTLRSILKKIGAKNNLQLKSYGHLKRGRFCCQNQTKSQQTINRSTSMSEVEHFMHFILKFIYFHGHCVKFSLQSDEKWARGEFFWGK